MRVAEITTRIVRVIEVPRSQLVEFLTLPEGQQVRNQGQIPINW